MGAYAAGSCREVRTSVYIWVLLLGIFAYVTLHVVFFKHLAPQCLRDMFWGIRAYWKNTLGHIMTPGSRWRRGLKCREDSRWPRGLKCREDNRWPRGFKSREDNRWPSGFKCRENNR
ncbi:unnamed protein product [Triticum turgidum subsp. durum]|uniref:Uncharacterized protein n=1 Tax=Triticum turgidum subsp. durum TaxID=4567 RepID=A0A9R0ZYW1_TRITD|nr:unnamed protein product [Triticum turgidum subsp. durum]